MSFLTNTGLAHFYSRIKEKFVQTITTAGPNGPEVLIPDSHGNITVNQVALADNLTSPDAQPSIGTYIWRTSGGSTNLQSGDANLVYVNGNMVAGDDRLPEILTVVSDTDLNVTIADADTVREVIDYEDGNYILSYAMPSNNTPISSNWEPEVSDWTYLGEDIESLESWGLSSDTVVAPTLSILAAEELSATVVPDTFITAVANLTDSYTFLYYENEWYLDTDSGSTQITLNTYGISVTEDPISDYSTIVITYTAGTPSTNVTISFRAYYPGTLYLATPTSFEATGLNQFDKNTMVIEGATISNNVITSSPGSYVCWCPAVGGEQGVIAKSIDGHILISGGMGWCAETPAIGSTVVTTSAHQDDSVTNTMADFTYLTDGYMVVVVDDPTDLMMWYEWSGDINQTTISYVPYVAPSSITIPTEGTIAGVAKYLPPHDYGMPRIGAVYDSINFETATYIQRIGHKDYSLANLQEIQEMDPVPAYDYDFVHGIFYVLEEPLIYTFENITGEYVVDDHGSERFVGTSVPVTAESLYGQNLRDKLRNDVVTISYQSLNSVQQASVRTNINAEQQIRYGSMTLPAANWTTHATGVWKQTVSISNITTNSMVDLHPNASTIGAMVNAGTAGIFALNDSGTITVYAVQATPTVDVSTQYTVTEIVQ